MSNIRHIVFDLGNVLIRWEPETPYRRLIPDDAARQRFLAEICNGDWLIQTDRGMSWEEAEEKLIARYPAEAPMIRAFRRNWHEMLPGMVEGTPEILEALLAAGWDVTALSNWAGDTYHEVGPRFPVLKRFRGVTVSAHVGLAKPDAGIYTRHIADFGLDPARTLFFDDNPVNVDAARKAGWQAERFVNAAGMRADLKRHGISI